MFQRRISSISTSSLRSRTSTLRTRVLSRSTPPTLARFVTVESEGRLANSETPLTTKLAFFDTVNHSAGDSSGLVPAYRVLSKEGVVLEGATVPELSEEEAVRMYEMMNLLPAMDTVLYNVQRQGKISFYMTAHGEEAAIVGSAAALDSADEVLGQYREMGVLLWRGFGIDACMAQCVGNEEDHSTKGKQMPVHFSSPEHHFHTISSPLGTQIPQAAGVSYALKRDPERNGKNCAIVYFGEGAASEGDFHAGMLMASTLHTPTIFFCRNNGFAISTPSSEQYVGDGIVSRGPGYGVKSIRVDGNDVLAVYNATKAAREYAIQHNKPVLIEAMTYRVGHHSTSDDSFAYRGRQEVEHFKKTDNPIFRMRQYLEAPERKWWTAEKEEEMKSRQKKEVMKSFKRAEGLKRWQLEQVFEDVYDPKGGLPWYLKEQKAELGSLLQKYGGVWEPWKKELASFKGNGQELK